MINQLVSKIQKTGAPIVVGLDPMMKFVPEHIQKKAFDEYGEIADYAKAREISDMGRQLMSDALDRYEATK